MAIDRMDVSMEYRFSVYTHIFKPLSFRVFMFQKGRVFFISPFCFLVLDWNKVFNSTPFLLLVWSFPHPLLFILQHWFPTVMIDYISHLPQSTNCTSRRSWEMYCSITESARAWGWKWWPSNIRRALTDEVHLESFIPKDSTKFLQGNMERKVNYKY